MRYQRELFAKFRKEFEFFKWHSRSRHVVFDLSIDQNFGVWEYANLHSTYPLIEPAPFDLFSRQGILVGRPPLGGHSTEIGMRNQDQIGRSARDHLIHERGEILSARAARPQAIVAERTGAHLRERNVRYGDDLGLILSWSVDGRERTGGAPAKHVLDAERIGGPQCILVIGKISATEDAHRLVRDVLDSFFRFAHARVLFIIRDVPKRFLGVQARDRISLCGETLEILRVFFKHIILCLHERAQTSLVEFILPMPHAFDLLELEKHDEPVGHSLRSPNSSKVHSDQKGCYSNAPPVQPNFLGDMAHRNAPLRAPAIKQSPSASTNLDLDQSYRGWPQSAAVAPVRSQSIQATSAREDQMPRGAVVRNTGILIIFRLMPGLE